MGWHFFFQKKSSSNFFPFFSRKRLFSNPHRNNLVANYRTEEKLASLPRYTTLSCCIFFLIIIYGVRVCLCEVMRAMKCIVKHPESMAYDKVHCGRQSGQYNIHSWRDGMNWLCFFSTSMYTFLMLKCVCILVFMFSLSPFLSHKWQPCALFSLNYYRRNTLPALACHHFFHNKHSTQCTHPFHRVNFVLYSPDNLTIYHCSHNIRLQHMQDIHHDVRRQIIEYFQLACVAGRDRREKKNIWIIHEFTIFS